MTQNAWTPWAAIDAAHFQQRAITGAGMQGTVASVVFAAPGEVSSFIKESCP